MNNYNGCYPYCAPPLNYNMQVPFSLVMGPMGLGLHPVQSRNFAMLRASPLLPARGQYIPCSPELTSNAAPGRVPMKNQTTLDYLVVIDFEATCEENSKKENPEIIQFPAVLVNVRSRSIVDTFDSFVKPIQDPLLSKFCTKLTGISQEDVDEAPTFPQVLKKFENWLKSHGLGCGVGQTFAIVVDGVYDLGHFLFTQCVISQVPFPVYAIRYVNLRTTYWEAYKQPWHSLKAVLEQEGEAFEGRQHNGLDDAKNITKLLLKLLNDGKMVVETDKILLDVHQQQQNAESIPTNRKSFMLKTVRKISSIERNYLSMGLGLPSRPLFYAPSPFNIRSNLDLISDHTSTAHDLNKENQPCCPKAEDNHSKDSKQ